jgi:predicted acetyltransferase
MSEGDYSWKTPVLEAFAAPHEAAKPKVHLAQQAIAMRLHVSPIPDWYETQELEKALTALVALGVVVDPMKAA